MDIIALQDLIEGRNDWCNIPEILRATLRVFHDSIQTQMQITRRLQQDYRVLHEDLERKADFVEFNNILKLKANTNDLLVRPGHTAC